MQVQLLQSGNLVCGQSWKADWGGGFHHKLYYVLGGTCFYEDRGEKVRLRQGCLYVFPMLSRCLITHNPADPFQVLWFHIDTMPPLGDPVMEIDVGKEPPPVYQILEALKMLSPADGALREPETVELLLNALFTSLEIRGRLACCSEPAVSAAIAYIRENISGAIDNQVLAGLSGYSPGYFIKLFQRVTGLTPHRYVHVMRLAAAKACIREGLSLKETAERCGIEDPNALSRDFKRYFGITPSQYRAQEQPLP